MPSSPQDYGHIEYQSLYNEISSNSDSMDRYRLVCFTATAAIIGATLAIKQPNAVFLPFILLTPFIVILPSMAAVRSRLYSTVRIAAYIRAKYEHSNVRWQTDIQEWRYYDILGKYNLRLMSVDRSDELVDNGRNLVIVALVATNLHIRIFDAKGNRVVDKAENQLMSGEMLATFKNQLNPLPDESGLSPEQKRKIIWETTLITDHPLKENSNLRTLMRSLWFQFVIIGCTSALFSFISLLILYFFYLPKDFFYLPKNCLAVALLCGFYLFLFVLCLWGLGWQSKQLKRSWDYKSFDSMFGTWRTIMTINPTVPGTHSGNQQA